MLWQAAVIYFITQRAERPIEKEFEILTKERKRDGKRSN